MSFLGALGEVLRRALARIDGQTLEIEAVEARLSARMDELDNAAFRHRDHHRAKLRELETELEAVRREPPTGWIDRERLEGHAKLLVELRHRVSLLEGALRTEHDLTKDLIDLELDRAERATAERRAAAGEP